MAGNPSTLYSDAVAFLDDVWSEERGLFPYSTAVIGGSYVDDFRLQGSIRYTINSLLGLRRASQPTQDKVDRFLERQYASIESNADFGLLLALLDDQLDRPEAQDALRRVEAVIAAGAPRSSMQELGWMLWGLSAVANAGGSTRASAERLFERIRARSVHPKTGLPGTICRSRGATSSRSERSSISCVGSTSMGLHSATTGARSSS